jgi:hypothetical protein
MLPRPARAAFRALPRALLVEDRFDGDFAVDFFFLEALRLADFLVGAMVVSALT